MNKQELIKELKEEKRKIEWKEDKYELHNAASGGKERAYSLAIDLAKQLDEPKKVVVPKFVAEKIKSYGSALEMLANEYFDQSSEEVDSDVLACWIDGNADLFFKAWIHGYEVETEQLYYVKLPGVGYLNNADGGIKHTEQEIKSIDERYWPFAVKVEGKK